MKIRVSPDSRRLLDQSRQGQWSGASARKLDCFELCTRISSSEPSTLVGLHLLRCGTDGHGGFLTRLVRFFLPSIAADSTGGVIVTSRLRQKMYPVTGFCKNPLLSSTSCSSHSIKLIFVDTLLASRPRWKVLSEILTFSS